MRTCATLLSLRHSSLLCGTSHDRCWGNHDRQQGSWRCGVRARRRRRRRRRHVSRRHSATHRLGKAGYNSGCAFIISRSSKRQRRLRQFMAAAASLGGRAAVVHCAGQHRCVCADMVRPQQCHRLHFWLRGGRSGGRAAAVLAVAATRNSASANAFRQWQCGTAAS
jgi:hypothetical protein